MSRNSYLCLLFATILAAAAHGQQGLPDQAFDRIPFDQWLKGEDDAHIKWSMEIARPHLSVHQRISVAILVRVDGAEFVKRNGHAQMVLFMEFRDRDNRVFRTHQAVHFDELKNPGSLASVNFDHFAFIVPGDYQVATAILDTGSNEHSVKRSKLHVAELPHDPLADSWRELPEVEFVSIADMPEGWFYPEISSRMNLPVQNTRPVRVEVVVNESPTELAARRVGRTTKRNMGNVIPALKVLSQLDIKNGSMNMTLLDLERRKVSFNQEAVKNLDWPRLRAALLENDPNSIDVHALENHEQNAQFFVSEVRKRLEEPGDAARVLIVLSGPMAFPKGQDLRPIEATPEPGVRVFYIRYNPPIFGAMSTGGLPGIANGRRPMPPATIGFGRGGSIEDSLARTLKPLAPRLFDVTTPMEFRSALAAIMSEISQLK